MSRYVGFIQVSGSARDSKIDRLLAPAGDMPPASLGTAKQLEKQSRNIYPSRNRIFRIISEPCLARNHDLNPNLLKLSTNIFFG
jgi:hypothetical protein